MKYYILVYTCSYPEDGPSDNVVGIYDNKELALKELSKGADRNDYEFVSMYEMEEEQIYKDGRNDIDKYQPRNGFIMIEDKIVWHQDTQLIERNEKLFEKNKQLNEKINQLNEIYKMKYDQDMELYKQKKIRHPILKTYKESRFYNYPYEKNKIEKVEKDINSELVEVENIINGFSSNI